MANLNIGTRGSKLALAQANIVKAEMIQRDPSLEGRIKIKVISTTGDRIQDKPLAEFGGKGLFTKEIDLALLAGEIDLAVHSMKDVPTIVPDGITFSAILARASVQDVLICQKAASIHELPEKALIGTSSLRRAAQLLHLRPDLEICPLRGAVPTRLKKVEEGNIYATLLAKAGLDRLGLKKDWFHILNEDEFLPAVAQGAIGIAVNSSNPDILATTSLLDNEPSRICVECERAFLRRLDGSCREPIAGLATLRDGRLMFSGLIATTDGAALYSTTNAGEPRDREEVGKQSAEEVLAKAGRNFNTH